MTTPLSPTITTIMKALVLAEYGRMTVEDRPRPAPADGMITLRILFTGICGSDLHGFTGENGRRFPGQVMGHETVARVSELPDAYAGELSEGQLVTVNPTLACGKCRACAAGRDNNCSTRRVIGVDPAISSAFAEYMSVPERNVVPLPESMPIEYGALVEPLAVGYHAAVRGAVAANDDVLVIGAGPIGQAAILAAFRLGARRVLVSELSPSRRELAVALGAELLPLADTSDALRELASDGVDVTIDAVGSSGTLALALTATRLGGDIVLVGMNAPEVTLSAYEVSTQERRIVGAFCYTDAEFRDTALWAAEAELDVLVSQIVALDAAPDAFTALAETPELASKILVDFS